MSYNFKYRKLLADGNKVIFEDSTTLDKAAKLSVQIGAGAVITLEMTPTEADEFRKVCFHSISGKLADPS